MSPRKIIGFDGWTQGAHHYERLVDELGRNNYELTLIHMGSWGHERGRPKEEVIGALNVRDISYYETDKLDYILDREQPDVVIFLSMQSFAHRALNRHCMKRGIPTLHLYHGLVSVQSTAEVRLNPVNWKMQVAMLFPRVWINLTKIIPVYMRALVRTDAEKSDWKWLAVDIWRKIVGSSYSGKAAPDTKTTACCVYAEADVLHAVERYGMDRGKVYAIGNPDLISFKLDANLANAHVTESVPDRRAVLYVDTALIEVGSTFDNKEDFVDHLRKTAASLKGLGYKLIVKLHPVHYRTGVLKLLEGTDLEVCNNEQFIEVAKRCVAAIVEPSSASMIPAIIGAPIMLARYGKLMKQHYGTVLKTYPKARELTCLDEFPRELNIINEGNDNMEMKKWIDKNIGPLPAGDISIRVINVIKDIDRNRFFQFRTIKNARRYNWLE